MRRLILLPMLVVFLGGLQTVITDGSVYAIHELWHCCSCGMCDSDCYCAYESPFCYCAAPEGQGIRPGHHEDEVTIDIRGMKDSRVFMTAQMNIYQRLRIMTSRERSSGHLALKVLDGYEKGLKVWCPGSDKSLPRDNSSIVRVADSEQR